MAFSGGLGVDLDLDAIPVDGPVTATARAFAEDPSRYLLEVRPGDLDRLTSLFDDLPFAVIGGFRTDADTVVVTANGVESPAEPLGRFHDAWQEGCRR